MEPETDTCCVQPCKDPECLPPCNWCKVECLCTTGSRDSEWGPSETPELVIAGLFLILHDRFSREYLPETDGPPSTREVFNRLTNWAEKTVFGA